ncbi:MULTISPECIES: PRC-barrel domain-containing protein [Kordiimonas]|jgi:sporulation protein YlmC with PRC-barrel domain|uniref:PRC-barrel domain-containing protein n=1 Tax=Kordiimonas TaxID=288021 RepID=UPI00257B66F8|nr:PRC-barrel domain-containing protein [Kordiimonas sp. UBA4487]
MLCPFTELKSFDIRGRDETLGELEDCLLTEVDWSVQYLTAKTGNWLTGRTVLIKEDCLTAIDPNGKTVMAALSKEKFKNLPDEASDPPVNKQKQQDLANNYAWVGAAGAGFMAFSPDAVMQDAGSSGDDEAGDDGNNKLRSMEELIGYDVVAGDTALGAVTDIMIDPTSWRARFLAVRRKKSDDIIMLVPCECIEAVSWGKRTIQCQEKIQSQAPVRTAA